MNDIPPTSEQAPPPQQPPSRDRSKAWLIAAVFVLAIAVAVLATLFLTADDDDTADTATSSTTTTAAPSGGGGGGGSQRTTTTAESDDVNPAETCRGSAVVAAVGGEIDGIPVRVVDMSCTVQGGGYAWAILEPSDGTVADPLTVYFRVDGGRWTMLNYGTDISCTGSGIPASVCSDLP